jgi:hypothetical protein
MLPTSRERRARHLLRALSRWEFSELVCGLIGPVDLVEALSLAECTTKIEVLVILMIYLFNQTTAAAGLISRAQAGEKLGSQSG